MNITMTRRDIRNSVFVACLAALLVAASQSAHALTVFVERLTYTANGSIAFQDEFNDPASVPNFSNGNPGAYSSFGSPGPEANGKLRMSTDNGLPASGATGTPTIATRLRLNSNVNPNNQTGIRPAIGFGASVLFDLPGAGFGAGEGFSLRLGEITPGGTLVRSMQLRVGRIGDAAPRIAFRLEDFLADTITTISSTALVIPGGADQLLLSLDRTASGNPVTAAFQFFDDGVEDGAQFSFGGSITPFLYEDRMRIEMLVSATVVPVPGSLALLLSGVAVAGIAAGKRGRKRQPALQ
jgi:hypothetical protein